MNLLNKASILLLLVIVSCRNKKAEPSFETMNEGELVNKHFFFSLPYENSSDSAAVITVTINGKPRRFILDTGAPLAISRSLQKEMNYRTLVNTTTIDSNGDTAGVEIVQVSSLFIDNLEFINIPAVILDMEQQMFSCYKVDGLVGSNLLRSLILQFNKPEQKIYLGDNIDSFKLKANTAALEMSLNFVQSNPVVQLTLNNGTIDSCLFDSGDKVLYTISKSSFDRINKQGKFHNNIVFTGTGVGEQGIVAKNTDHLEAFVARFDSVVLGKQTIKNVYTEPNYSSSSRMGRGLWDYGFITMDYPRKKFYLTPYANNIELPTPFHFGFKYQERNGKLVITVVWENTQASNCGLKPGFEILQFGNLIPTSVSKCEWQNLCTIEAQANTLFIKYRNEKSEIKQCTLNKISFNASK